MLKSVVIMKYIDKLRHTDNLKVSELNEGVISIRNYSRYLKGEFELPFNVLVQYLEKLNMKLEDFLIYIYNDIKSDYIEHHEFINAVSTGQYDLAESIYQKMDKQIRTEVSDILVPANCLKLQYETKQITKPLFIEKLDDLLKLNTLLKANVISREEQEAIYIYLDYCCEKDTDRIIEFLNRFYIGKTLKIVSLEHSLTELNNPLRMIGVLLKKNHITKKDLSILESLFDLIIEQSIHFNISKIYDELLEYFLVYYKLTKNVKKYEMTIFYYVSYMLSNNYDFINYKTIMNPKNLRIYRKYMSSAELSNKSFYKVMVSTYETA